MKKVSVVIGTRPEAIKMAPVIHALSASNSGIELDLCVTGQHRALIDPMLEWFEIKQDADFRLMKHNQSLPQLTAAILKEMSQYYAHSNPDFVLVHGDTTTANGAAISAFLSGIPVGHVEAGLRTHDLRSPFPEEFNRQIISKAARLHFAPTEWAKHNLIRESVPKTSILVTGNTAIDALLWTERKIHSGDTQGELIISRLVRLLEFDVQSERYVLVTGHRRENFGNGLREICAALRELANSYPDTHFVYPVHLNPNVLQPVTHYLSGVSNIHLIEPLSYELFTYIMSQCHFILTDSGGIQEEAPTFGKPVLVLRHQTERPEAVEVGAAQLVGSSQAAIVETSSLLLDNPAIYNSMCPSFNPFGDGKAAGRILAAIQTTGTLS